MEPNRLRSLTREMFQPKNSAPQPFYLCRFASISLNWYEQVILHITLREDIAPCGAITSSESDFWHAIS